MSEYQFYEFSAVDRPLDERQLVAVRALSTRARSTPTSDTDEWGNFRGEPRRLVGLLWADDPHPRAETLRRVRPAPVDSGGRRSAGQLVEGAGPRRDEREGAAVESAPRVAEVQREQLAASPAEAEAGWACVATRIAGKEPAGYDAAVELLVDLQEVTGEAEFGCRVDALRVGHRRKPALLERLAVAGL